MLVWSFYQIPAGQVVGSFAVNGSYCTVCKNLSIVNFPITHVVNRDDVVFELILGRLGLYWSCMSLMHVRSFNVYLN